MARHCETFEHTADIGLAGRADSLAGLFEAMGEGLARYLCPARPRRADRSSEVDLSAPDVEALLVDFLSAVNAAVLRGHLLVGKVAVEEITPTRVRARLTGTDLDSRRDEITTEVKAVTYHQLEVRQRDGQWTARVILDI